MKSKKNNFKILAIALVTFGITGCSSNDSEPSQALIPNGAPEVIEAYTFGNDDMLITCDGDEFDAMIRPKGEYSQVVGNATQCKIIGAYSYDPKLFGVEGADPWIAVEVDHEGDSIDFGWLKATTATSDNGDKGLHIEIAPNPGRGRYVKVNVLCSTDESAQYIATIAVKQTGAVGNETGPHDGFILTPTNTAISPEGGEVYIDVKPNESYESTVDAPESWEFSLYSNSGSWAKAERIDGEGGKSQIRVSAEPNNGSQSREVRVAVKRDWPLGEIELAVWSHILFWNEIVITQKPL